MDCMSSIVSSSFAQVFYQPRGFGCSLLQCQWCPPPAWTPLPAPFYCSPGLESFCQYFGLVYGLAQLGQGDWHDSGKGVGAKWQRTREPWWYGQRPQRPLSFIPFKQLASWKWHWPYPMACPLSCLRQASMQYCHGLRGPVYFHHGVQGYIRHRFAIQGACLRVQWGMIENTSLHPVHLATRHRQASPTLRWRKREMDLGPVDSAAPLS